MKSSKKSDPARVSPLLTGRHTISTQPVVCHFFPLTHAVSAGSEAISKSYDALPHIRSDHVIAVHAVEKMSEGPETGIMLVMAPAPEKPLAEFIQQTELPFIDRLAIAVQLAAAVNDMHQAGFIHKGLTLEGIAVDPDGQSIKVADFAPPAPRSLSMTMSPSRLYRRIRFSRRFRARFRQSS
jgi:serine/threonine protein kinase